MTSSRRRLPHVYPSECWLFLTWNLHGAIPEIKYPPPEKKSAGKAFLWMDRRLDLARTGPLHLRRPEIAEIVIASLFQGERLRHYALGPFVVMPNHVHLLLRPRIAPSLLLQSLKGASARQANARLGLTGEPFWQRETFDHQVRGEREWQRIAAYIANNPVRAGLAQTTEEYPWSSCHERWRSRVGTLLIGPDQAC